MSMEEQILADVGKELLPAVKAKVVAMLPQLEADAKKEAAAIEQEATHSKVVGWLINLVHLSGKKTTVAVHPAAGVIDTADRTAANWQDPVVGVQMQAASDGSGTPATTEMTVPNAGAPAGAGTSSAASSAAPAPSAPSPTTPPTSSFPQGPAGAGSGSSSTTPPSTSTGS